MHFLGANGIRAVIFSLVHSVQHCNKQEIQITTSNDYRLLIYIMLLTTRRLQHPMTMSNHLFDAYQRRNDIASIKDVDPQKQTAKPTVDYQSRAIKFQRYPDTLPPLLYDQKLLNSRPEFEKYTMRKNDVALPTPSTDLVAYIHSSYTESTPTHEPEICMYGVTPEGHTVNIRVRDFLPYCFVAIPTEYLDAFASDAERLRLARTLYEHIGSALRTVVRNSPALLQKYGKRYENKELLVPLPKDAELDRILYDARDLKMYNTETRKLLKITVREPALIPVVKELLWLPLGWNYNRCSVCQFKNGDRSDLDKREQTLLHHKSCPAKVHRSCAAEFGRERREQRYLDEKWFSMCQMCTGYYCEERLQPPGSELLNFSTLRDTMYGGSSMFGYEYHNWIRGFLKECRDYGKPLSLPMPVAMDDWVMRQRIERLGHTPQHPSFTVYNADIPFTARAMADQQITYSWVRLPAGRWTSVNSKYSRTISHVEALCTWRNVLPHERSEMPALIQMSLDMEMYTDGAFCRFDRDPILQVPMSIKNSKTGESCAVLFALGELPPRLNDQDVFCYPYSSKSEMREAERRMIADVCLFAAVVQPTVVLTWNGTSFDIPYFVRRGLELEVPAARSFLSLRRGYEGDIKWRPDILREREITRITMKGVFFFDVMYWIMKTMNGGEWSAGYDLNTASWLILKQRKNDIDASRMGEYQQTLTGREMMGLYAGKDVDLVQRISDAKKLIPSIMTLASMLGVPVQDVTECGNNHLMSIALFRYATLVFSKELDGLMCVFPTPRKMLTHPKDKVDKYKGAVVIEPLVGFYEQPVATLDYSSLYPSIMRERNLCQSTYVEPEVIELYKLDAKDVWQRPTHEFTDTEIIETMEEHNPRFLSLEKYHGFIPRFQKFMTDERKRVRSKEGVLKPQAQDLETEIARSTDAAKIAECKEQLARIESEMQIVDIMQNVYKTLSNSVYGLMGLERSAYYRRAIAETITLTGRYALMSGKVIAETTYTKANGYAGDLVVIAGDTDSIMCILKNCDYKDHEGYLFSLMFELSAKIKKLFSILDMQPEKLYLIYKISGKKNYMALKMDLTGSVTVDIKGFKFKKKISSIMHRETCKQIFNDGFVGGDVMGAVKYVRDQLVRIHTRQASIHDLASSGCFSKSFLDTSAHNAPMAAAMRVYQRTGREIRTTERIRYIILEDHKAIRGVKSKKSERAELALYAENQGLQYDADYYIEDLIKTVTPLLLHLVPKKLGGHDKDKLRKLLLDHPVLRARAQTMVTAESALFKAWNTHGGSTVTKSKCVGCRGAIVEIADGSKRRPYVRVEYEPDQPVGLKRKAPEGGFDVEPPTKRRDIQLSHAMEIDCADYKTDVVAHSVCGKCQSASAVDVQQKLDGEYVKALTALTDAWHDCAGCTFSTMKGASLAECINDSCPSWNKRNKALRKFVASAQVLEQLHA